MFVLGIDVSKEKLAFYGEMHIIDLTEIDFAEMDFG